jgi:deoxyribodipyrimidine photolyase
MARTSRQSGQRAAGALRPCHDDMVQLAKQLGVQAVFTHHDDEPQSLARDAQVLGELANAGIAFHSFKDHVVFERSEVLTQSGTAYGVFTPYKNAWMKKITPADLAERRTVLPSRGNCPPFLRPCVNRFRRFKSMGFDSGGSGGSAHSSGQRRRAGAGERFCKTHDPL